VRPLKVDGVPAMFLGWGSLLIRGYGLDDRLVHGTGRIVPARELGTRAAALLVRPKLLPVPNRARLARGGGCMPPRHTLWEYRRGVAGVPRGALASGRGIRPKKLPTGTGWLLAAASRDEKRRESAYDLHR
jgi:hypothetical protein